MDLIFTEQCLKYATGNGYKLLPVVTQTYRQCINSVLHKQEVDGQSFDLKTSPHRVTQKCDLAQLPDEQ